MNMKLYTDEFSAYYHPVNNMLQTKFISLLGLTAVRNSTMLAVLVYLRREK